MSRRERTRVRERYDTEWMSVYRVHSRDKEAHKVRCQCTGGGVQQCCTNE